MHALTWFTLTLILGAVQGLFLMVMLIFGKAKQAVHNKYLILLIGVIFCSLLLRIFYDSELYMRYPHVSEAGDFVMFVFGPILLAYVNSLLYTDFKRTSSDFLHFIPLLLFVTVLAYLFSIDKEVFIAMKGSRGIQIYYVVLLSVAIIQNAIYILLSLRKTVAYRSSFYGQFSQDHKIQYLLVILSIMFCCVMLWLVAFVSSLISSFDIYWINFYYQMAFFGLASLSYVIAFYAISNPDVFKVHMNINKERYQHSTLLREDIDAIKKRLERSLGKEKLFIDPKLSLSKLALAINTNQVHLSRVINESYNKNFFEFVNSYRIKDFISKVLSEDFKHYTYLGIALESGFNTKTTFNKAFKKVTSMTPREFFKSTHELIKELQ